jgi:Integrase core domain
LANGVLSLQRRLYCGKLDALKSKAGRRSLPLPESLIARLEKLKPETGEGFIFRCANGKPLNQANLRNRYLKPAARKLGISIGFHDFRHTVSTDLRRCGFHPSLDDAKEKLTKFREHYNRERPHSSLADRTPSAFAALHREKASTSLGRNPRQQKTKGLTLPKPLTSPVTENGSGPFVRNHTRTCSETGEQVRCPTKHMVLD